MAGLGFKKAGLLMKRKLKILLSIILSISLLFSLTTSFSHSGRTDASGGHYNRATGEYHYHHGEGPHQHENGKCPYDSWWYKLWKRLLPVLFVIVILFIVFLTYL